MASQYPFATTSTISTINSANLSTRISMASYIGNSTPNNLNNSSNLQHVKGTELHVTGPARFDGKVTMHGEDLHEMLKQIRKRLLILVPDPKKLAKFEALQKAYDHYLLLEALCYEDKDDR